MTHPLIGVEIENLHGFQRATLGLDRERMVIVGPNNSGKTAALTLIDWLLNRATDGEIRGQTLRPESEAVLLPARDTRNSARRLNLHVRQTGKAKPAHLRYRVLTSGGTHGYLRSGAAVRGEKHEAAPEALKILGRFREEFRFVHVPSFRDAQSERFSSTLKEAYLSRLEERALHVGRGRKRRESQQLNRAISTLRTLTNDLVGPLWNDIKSELPAGLARDGQFEFSAPPERVLDWLVESLEFRLSTADHDALGVGVDQVGAGLQSLLDLAVNASGASEGDVPVLLAVEEPEAFLHPSAQRTLARRLLADRPNTRVIITTHSPLVVDEASAADVVVVKHHTFYQPSLATDDAQAKRSAFMTGSGAEAMFSHGVLLVEGDGDRQFFEALRRRFAAVDEAGCLDRLHVLAVGSKNYFAPWIRLFDAYGRGEDRPIPWLAVPDADAATAIIQAFDETNTPLAKARASLQSASQAFGNVDLSAWKQHSQAVNTACRDLSIPLRLLFADLEQAMLDDASEATWKDLADAAGVSVNSRGGLMRKLGSKGVDGTQSGNAVKAPWIRGLIGRQIPLNELSTNVGDVLSTWYGFVMDDAATFVEQHTTA
ncbi:ATP-dependent nuclease [Rubrivirga litoralis]|uniref:ATP-binding protein n=1 Tax=Rubrivirga litoralis TaxID=3075598 RepID=A0ABU3BQ97_9BACT|nr:ATP-binding protein [Rubrivirga sp. F394]MDT0631443.1 ATP-binding protein [Rubrivirga sp. F394]